MEVYVHILKSISIRFVRGPFPTHDCCSTRQAVVIHGSTRNEALLLLQPRTAGLERGHVRAPLLHGLAVVGLLQCTDDRVPGVATHQTSNNQIMATGYAVFTHSRRYGGKVFPRTFSSIYSSTILG